MQVLSPQELQRYNRHIILSEIGLEGQIKLKEAKVLVVGAGGLGCPILQYLSAAGVGRIGIVDHDTVSESNLHRQILFSTADVGKPKAGVAAQKLTSQNPFVRFDVFQEKITSENALRIIEDFDIVVDGTDNFPTRYLINDACVIAQKILIYGAIFKFDGQVSVFNYKNGPTYRCLFPEPPKPEDVPSCAQVGVIGVLPGLIGTMQANETIKVILGIGEVLKGKLFYFDALTMQSQILEFDRNDEVANVKELVDYQEFCGVRNTSTVRSFTVDELAEIIDDENLVLLDVREGFELQIAKIKDPIHIPLGQLASYVSHLNREKKTIVYCHHGMRSAMAISLLQKEYGFANLYNLEGGIDEYTIEIDNSLTRY